MGYTYKMTQVLVAVGPRIQFLLIRIHLVCTCVCARVSVHVCCIQPVFLVLLFTYFCTSYYIFITY